MTGNIIIEFCQKRIFLRLFQQQFAAQVVRHAPRQTGFACSYRALDYDVAIFFQLHLFLLSFDLAVLRMRPAIQQQSHAPEYGNPAQFPEAVATRMPVDACGDAAGSGRLVALQIIIHQYDPDQAFGEHWIFAYAAMPTLNFEAGL